MAETFQKPPSEYFGIRHPLAAYNFDKHVLNFGRHVKGLLEEKKAIPYYVKGHRRTRYEPKYKTLQSALKKAMRDYGSPSSGMTKFEAELETFWLSGDTTIDD